MDTKILVREKYEHKKSVRVEFGFLEWEIPIWDYLQTAPSVINLYAKERGWEALIPTAYGSSLMMSHSNQCSIVTFHTTS